MERLTLSEALGRMKQREHLTPSRLSCDFSEGNLGQLGPSIKCKIGKEDSAQAQA